MEKIFVYGKLKDGNSKAWYLPAPKTEACRLPGFKMFLVRNGVAGAIKGNGAGFIDGEIKTLRLPFLQKFLLDLNEGTFKGVYKRHKISTQKGEVWIYLYNRPTNGCKEITDWIEHK